MKIDELKNTVLKLKTENDQVSKMYGEKRNQIKTEFITKITTIMSCWEETLRTLEPILDTSLIDDRKAIRIRMPSNFQLFEMAQIGLKSKLDGVGYDFEVLLHELNTGIWESHWFPLTKRTLNTEFSLQQLQQILNAFEQFGNSEFNKNVEQTLITYKEEIDTKRKALDDETLLITGSKGK